MSSVTSDYTTDFFTVSLTVTDLAKDLHKTATDITWGITLVLMFRSVGAVAFGLAVSVISWLSLLESSSSK